MLFYCLLLFLILLAALFLWSLAGRRGMPGLEQLRQYRYAHRGLHDAQLGIPENSLTAFRRAAEHGFGVELDIHLLKDGTLAVMHDSSLHRMVGIDQNICEYTAASLAPLRLKGTDEPIPLLEDVLPILAGRVPLILELKTDNGNGDALACAACAAVDRYPDLCYCIESFDPRPIQWLRRNRPEIIRGQLSQDFGKKQNEVKGFHAFCATNLLCNLWSRPDFVAYKFSDRKKTGLQLCLRFWHLQEASWTLRSEDQLRSAEQNGSIPIFEQFIPE